ncbi:Myb-like DNA-binding domain containing protein [Trichomonas vaginalis G3]|uniref:Myb-like DNA-binding domain containing protein n=1 Tax=Trichomonas vaginalis (strain ATCC PRA-98 / G3) TaxID=412133 RepID=A2E223_TRIV3|nr:guanine nucleotide exchange factor family [Trichomonas vaginalis G3]EAY13237.1 Myb-like DNA-binding domain containing protein [Trichomonas vaginalis G3]KAI5494104.1 guanine nucleotide exchange factor family [Trichomonas vaginalis G3]|eukprot:XP_001325460.1 Myb-like DNA-binding domain containing protein [Trichomonas vaginalis G3]
MRIKVGAPYNRVCFVLVDKFTTIFGVKHVLSEILQIPIQNLHIYKESTELNDHIVCQNNISENDNTISCTIAENPSKSKINFFQKENLSQVDFLTNLGFPETQVTEALQRTNFDQQKALSILLNTARILPLTTENTNNTDSDNSSQAKTNEEKLKISENFVKNQKNIFNNIKLIPSLSLTWDTSLNQDLINAYNENRNSPEVWRILRDQFPTFSDLVLKRAIFSMLDDIKNKRSTNFIIPDSLKPQNTNQDNIIDKIPQKAINVGLLVKYFVEFQRNISELQRNRFPEFSQGYLAFILYLIVQKLTNLPNLENWSEIELQILTDYMYSSNNSIRFMQRMIKMFGKQKTEENIQNAKSTIHFILVSHPIYDKLPEIIPETIDISDLSVNSNGIPIYLPSFLDSIIKNPKLMAIIDSKRLKHPPIKLQFVDTTIDYLKSIDEMINFEKQQIETNTQQQQKQKQPPQQKPSEPFITPIISFTPNQQKQSTQNLQTLQTLQKIQNSENLQKNTKEKNSENSGKERKRHKVNNNDEEWTLEEDQFMIDIVSQNPKTPFSTVSGYLSTKSIQECYDRFKEVVKRIITNQNHGLKLPATFMSNPYVVSAVKSINNVPKKEENSERIDTDQKFLDLCSQFFNGEEVDAEKIVEKHLTMTVHSVTSRFEELCCDIRCGQKSDIKIPDKLKEFLKPFDGKFTYEFSELPKGEIINVARFLELYTYYNYDLYKVQENFERFNVGYLAYLAIYMIVKYNKKYVKKPTYRDWTPLEDRILLEMIYNDDIIKNYPKYNPSKTMKSVANRRSYIQRTTSKVQIIGKILRACKSFKFENPPKLNAYFVPSYLDELIDYAREKIDDNEDAKQLPFNAVYTQEENQLIIDKAYEYFDNPNKFDIISVYFPEKPSGEIAKHYRDIMMKYRNGSLKSVNVPELLLNEYEGKTTNFEISKPTKVIPIGNLITKYFEFNGDMDKLQESFKEFTKGYLFYILNFIVRKFLKKENNFTLQEDRLYFEAYFTKKSLLKMYLKGKTEKDVENRTNETKELLNVTKNSLMKFVQLLANNSFESNEIDENDIPLALNFALSEFFDIISKDLEGIQLEKGFDYQKFINIVGENKKYSDCWERVQKIYNDSSSKTLSQKFQTMIENYKLGNLNELKIPEPLYPEFCPNLYKIPPNPNFCLDISDVLSIFYKNNSFDELIIKYPDLSQGYFTFVFTRMMRIFNGKRGKVKFTERQDRIVLELANNGTNPQYICDVLGMFTMADINKRKVILNSWLMNFIQTFKEFNLEFPPGSFTKCRYNDLGLPDYLDQAVKTYRINKANGKYRKSNSKKVEEESESESETPYSSYYYSTSSSSEKSSTYYSSYSSEQEVSPTTAKKNDFIELLKKKLPTEDEDVDSSIEKRKKVNEYQNDDNDLKFAITSQIKRGSVKYSEEDSSDEPQLISTSSEDIFKINNSNKSISVKYDEDSNENHIPTEEHEHESSYEMSTPDVEERVSSALHITKQTTVSENLEKQKEEREPPSVNFAKEALQQLENKSQIQESTTDMTESDYAFQGSNGVSAEPEQNNFYEQNKQNIFYQQTNTNENKTTTEEEDSQEEENNNKQDKDYQEKEEEGEEEFPEEENNKDESQDEFQEEDVDEYEEEEEYFEEEDTYEWNTESEQTLLDYVQMSKNKTTVFREIANQYRISPQKLREKYESLVKAILNRTRTDIYLLPTSEEEEFEEKEEEGTKYDVPKDSIDMTEFLHLYLTNMKDIGSVHTFYPDLPKGYLIFLIIWILREIRDKNDPLGTGWNFMEEQMMLQMSTENKNEKEISKEFETRTPEEIKQRLNELYDIIHQENGEIQQFFDFMKTKGVQKEKKNDFNNIPKSLHTNMNKYKKFLSEKDYYSPILTPRKAALQNNSEQKKQNPPENKKANVPELKKSTSFELKKQNVSESKKFNSPEQKKSPESKKSPLLEPKKSNSPEPKKSPSSEQKNSSTPEPKKRQNSQDKIKWTQEDDQQLLACGAQGKPDWEMAAKLFPQIQLPVVKARFYYIQRKYNKLKPKSDKATDSDEPETVNSNVEEKREVHLEKVPNDKIVDFSFLINIANISVVDSGLREMFPEYQLGYLLYVIDFVNRKIMKVNEKMWTEKELRIMFEKIYRGVPPSDVSQMLQNKSPKQIIERKQLFEQSLKQNMKLLLEFADKFQNARPETLELDENEIPIDLKNKIQKYLESIPENKG